jgi:hypothetical protein
MKKGHQHYVMMPSSIPASRYGSNIHCPLPCIDMAALF